MALGSSRHPLYYLGIQMGAGAAPRQRAIQRSLQYLSAGLSYRNMYRLAAHIE